MNEIERVARAIDSIRLFMRFNDWTSDCVPGLPIEICRWTGEHDESCEVIARYPGQRESDGAAHLERHISEARATAAIAAMRGEPVGWIVGNSAGTEWRTWNAMGPCWTADRDKATRYARREDAELVHAEDEDAWRVEPYAGPTPPASGKD